MRSCAFFAVLVASVLALPQSAWAVKLPAGPADPTGEAREVAAAELNSCLETGWYGHADASAMKRAWLGEPYLSFWTDWAFTEFESAESNNVLQYLTRYSINFPVRLDDRVLGSINIVPNDVGWHSLPGGGRYVPGSRSIGDSQCVRVAVARAGLALSPGQRVSALRTDMSGHFLVIEDGASIVKMAPVYLGSTLQSAPDFLPVERYVESLRRDIRSYRKRMLDPANALDIHDQHD
jgi:hypothetical protein